MPRQERTKSGTGIYHVMLTRGLSRCEHFRSEIVKVNFSVHSLLKNLEVSK